MPDIYAQHAKAFEHVSAYVVAKDGDRIASVAFKLSRSGLRTTCYLHVTGTQMVRADSSGADDNQTAAFRAAIGKAEADDSDIRTVQCVGAFRDAVTDNGATWEHDLRKAGFNVWQAV